MNVAREPFDGWRYHISEYLSFLDWNGMTPTKRFVGLAN